MLDSEMLLLLTPRLLGKLELDMGYGSILDPVAAPSPGDSSAKQAADLVGRLGPQLAQCTGLQQLCIRCCLFAASLSLATELVLAPGLRRLQHLAVFTTSYPDAARQPAAALTLAAALAARHGSRPDAAATSRVLHVTTNLLEPEHGADDVMRALDAVGVRGARVVYARGLKPPTW